MNYKTSISINGKRLSSFIEIFLKQDINNHHEFKILVDHEEIEEIGGHSLDVSSKEWLGKPLVITFKDTEFLGVVTNIRMLLSDGHQSDIEVSGYSKTILLEQGKHTTSWLNKSLNDVINDTLNIVDLEAQVKLEHKGILEYEAQYGESHFQFIKRLSKQYNEWLFWDGTKLIIGKPDEKEAIALEYNRELSNLSIGVQVKANSYTTFSYNSNDNRAIASQTTNDIRTLNELGTEAFHTSLDIFNIVPNVHSISRVKDKNELDTSLKKKQAAAVADLNILEADCNIQGLTIGSIIKVGSAKSEGNNVFDVKSYGEYMVIAIEHKATGTDEYSCHFKAIPSGIAVLPEPKVELPHAHSQIATIVDNKDPRGFGRVKAKMLWQKNNETTTWLRVMTPDAGTSDEHGEIRGNLVIPEINDQVMIGFRYGAPNRPFILGSLYNGGNITAGKENRNSLVSRMGSKMVMDDNDGSLQLTDKGGVDMKFDGAGNAVTQIAKQNTIGVGENGESMFKMDAKGNIALDGKESLKITIGDSLFEMLANGTIKVNGKVITVNAETSTEIAAANNHIAGITKMDGGDVFIN